MEHRRRRRIPVRLAVTLSGRNTDDLHGEILDMTAEGAFIGIRDDASGLRNLVCLSAMLPGDESMQLKCRAFIVRKSESGIGVMFPYPQKSPFLQQTDAVRAPELLAQDDCSSGATNRRSAVLKYTGQHDRHESAR